MSDGIDRTKAAAAEKARRVKFRVAGNVVNQATVGLPDEQRGAIRWLHEHADALDLDIAEAAALVNLAADELAAIFQGSYQGELKPTVKRIEQRRKEWEALSAKARKGGPLGFIKTSQTSDLWQICDKARDWGKWAFIFGETQVGKTTALEAYGGEHCPTRLPHGSVVFTRVPAGGSLPHYLEELADKLRLSAQIKQYHLRRKIMDCFDDSMLLIVDEAHQCVMGRDRGNGARTIEFIRELSDRRKCGVVISATNVFEQAMDRGAMAGILKQSRERQIITYQVEPPGEEDLNKFAAAYGLQPAEDEALELQTETVTKKALGFWLTLLNMAAKLAHNQGKPLTWETVKRADIGLKALAKKAAQNGGAR